MSAVKQWYALYTAAGCERKVAEALGRKGIDNYYPVNCATEKYGRRDRATQVPLFPCMVFVRMGKTDHDAVKQLPGVLSMVYWLKEPAVFMNTEIEMLQRFLHEHPCVQLQKAAVMKEEMVKITGNAFARGESDEVNQDPIQLCLPSMGYVLSAVGPNKLELLEQRTAQQVKMFGNLAIIR